jgi:hypothetical protein
VLRYFDRLVQLHLERAQTVPDAFSEAMCALHADLSRAGELVTQLVQSLRKRAVRRNVLEMFMHHIDLEMLQQPRDGLELVSISPRRRRRRCLLRDAGDDVGHHASDLTRRDHSDIAAPDCLACRITKLNLVTFATLLGCTAHPIVGTLVLLLGCGTAMLVQPARARAAKAAHVPAAKRVDNFGRWGARCGSYKAHECAPLNRIEQMVRLCYADGQPGI